MPAGRPAKSTAELKKQGTYRKCRHEDRADTSPWPGMPEMPEGFTAPEQQMWDRIAAYVPDEVKAGADTEAMISLCKWWGVWWELQGLWDSAESLEDKPKLADLSKAWAAVQSLLIQFGMTPAARAKIKVIPKTAKEDKHDPLKAYVA